MPLELLYGFYDVIGGKCCKFIYSGQGKHNNQQQRKNEADIIQLQKEFEEVFKQIQYNGFISHNYYAQHIKLDPGNRSDENNDYSFITFNNILYELGTKQVQTIGKIIKENTLNCSDPSLYSPFQLCATNNRLYYLSVQQQSLFEIILSKNYDYRREFETKHILKLPRNYNISGIVPIANTMFFLADKGIYQLDSFSNLILIHSLEYEVTKNPKQLRSQSRNRTAEKNKHEYWKFWVYMKNILVYYYKNDFQLLMMQNNRLLCSEKYKVSITDVKCKNVEDLVYNIHFQYTPTIQSYMPSHDKHSPLFGISRSDIQQIQSQNLFSNLKQKCQLLQLISDLYDQLREQCETCGVTQAVINTFKVQQLNEKLNAVYKRVELFKGKQNDSVPSFVVPRSQAPKNRFILSTDGGAASAGPMGVSVTSAAASPRPNQKFTRSVSDEPVRSPSMYLKSGMRFEAMVEKMVSFGVEKSAPNEKERIEKAIRQNYRLLNQLMLLQMLFMDEVLDAMCHDAAAWNALLKGEFILENLEFYNIQVSQVHVVLFFSVFYDVSDESGGIQKQGEATKYLISNLYLQELQILKLIELGLLDSYSKTEYLELLANMELKQYSVEEVAYQCLDLSLLLTYYIQRDIGVTKQFVNGLCQRQCFDIFETMYFNADRYRALFDHGFDILKAMVQARVRISEKEELKDFFVAQWDRLHDEQKQELRQLAQKQGFNDQIIRLLK